MIINNVSNIFMFQSNLLSIESKTNLDNSERYLEIQPLTFSHEYKSIHDKKFRNRLKQNNISLRTPVLKIEKLNSIYVLVLKRLQC